MRRVHAAVAAACTVLLVATSQPAGAATTVGDSWAPPQTVTGLEPFDTPNVAASATGRALMVFYTTDDWYAVSRAAGSGRAWSEPQPLHIPPGRGHLAPLAQWPDGRITWYADGAVPQPLVTSAVDGTFAAARAFPYHRIGIGTFSGAGVGLPDGRLVVAGHTLGGVRAAVRAVDGSWTRSQKLAVPHTFVRGVWTEPDGTVKVAVVRPRAPKHDTGPELFSVTLRADGTWGSRQDVTLETHGRYGDGRFVGFASNAEGDASMLWAEYSRRQPKAVVSTRLAGGDWSAPAALQSNRVANRIHFLAPDGTTLVVTASDARGPDEGKLVAARLSRAGRWLGRQVVYEGLFQYIFVTVTGGAGADGTVLLGFNTRGGGAGPLQRFVRCPPGGDCVPTRSLSGDYDRWRQMLVTADGAGYVLAGDTSLCARGGEVCSRRLPPLN